MNEGGNSTATVLPEAKEESLLSVVEAVSAKEEVDGKLEQARQQLLALRRQQEELERQKGELEELRRKQDEYARGRAEMIDNLNRGLIVLEREQIEAQRLAELCDKTRTAFTEYHERIHSINDQDWSSDNVRGELSKALGLIENARLEYNRARTKLDCLDPAAHQPAPDPSAKTGLAAFDWAEALRYAWIGAAASAPLILAGTIWLIILVAHR